MLCAKFGWNWPSGYEEEYFLKNFINVFLLFRYYLPLEKDRVLHLKKLESPSPKDALCQVWLKLAQWFWRGRWKCEKWRERRTTDKFKFDKKNKRALTYYINMHWFAKKRDKYIYYLVAFFPCENISHIHGLCYSMMETAYIQTLALGPLSM